MKKMSAEEPTSTGRKINALKVTHTTDAIKEAIDIALHAKMSSRKTMLPGRRQEKERLDRDEWWMDPGEAAWNPSRQDAGSIEVETSDPDTLIGVLFLPGDEIHEVRYALPTFGFARHLDED